jgi:hypothetical protein
MHTNFSGCLESTGPALLPFQLYQLSMSVCQLCVCVVGGVRACIYSVFLTKLKVLAEIYLLYIYLLFRQDLSM